MSEKVLLDWIERDRSELIVFLQEFVRRRDQTRLATRARRRISSPTIWISRTCHIG